MHFRLHIILNLLVVLLTCRCASAATEVRRVEISGWPEAFCINNGTVELTVVPTAGRILGFGFVGGPNVLWQGYTPANAPLRKDRWINAGGDRVLPWPQSDWPDRIGRIWPPPLATEIKPHQLEILSDQTLRMTSPVIPEYGVRLIRVIRLHKQKPQVEIESIMKRVAPGPHLAMSPWIISQCRADSSTRVIARRENANNSLKTITMLDRPWPVKRELSLNTAEFLLPGITEAKTGLNAEILSVETDGTILIQRAIRGQAEKENLERAQIFSPIMTQDGRPTGDSFVEIEFIGQPKILSVDQHTSITLLWDLIRK